MHVSIYAVNSIAKSLCGTLTHTDTRAEEPLKIAEVVVTVKSRIQEMNRECICMRQVHDLAGWV